MDPLAQHETHDFCEKNVTGTEIKSDDENNNDNHPGRGKCFFPGRPGYLGELYLDFIDKILGFGQHRHTPFVCCQENGRPGGTRTPNTRFWRPVL